MSGTRHRRKCCTANSTVTQCTQQLNLFRATSAPADPLVGITVSLPNNCACFTRFVVTDESTLLRCVEGVKT
jgi:hypothetical protein